jgi:hypothetical protein
MLLLSFIGYLSRKLVLFLASDCFSTRQDLVIADIEFPEMMWSSSNSSNDFWT